MLDMSTSVDQSDLHIRDGRSGQYTTVHFLLQMRHNQSLPVLTEYILAAIGLNLCVGYLGELSLGHAGFMCVGAYSSSLFSMIFKDAIPDALRFLLALAVGGIVAMIFGFLIAIPVLRLKGDYLAIATFAFGEIVICVFKKSV